MVDDWLTIWRSEMAALATDRELAEAWAATAALWARAAAAMMPPDGSAGRPGPPSPPRAAPAVAASDTGGAAERIEHLARRVEELERRLARWGEPPAA